MYGTLCHINKMAGPCPKVFASGEGVERGKGESDAGGM